MTTPVVRVNRARRRDHDLYLDVEQKRVVVHLSVTPSLLEKLSFRALPHHLEVHREKKPYMLVNLSKTVCPDTLQLHRDGTDIRLEIEWAEEAGQPKPVPPAASDETCSCVEHPRSRASDEDGEKEL